MLISSMVAAAANNKPSRFSGPYSIVVYYALFGAGWIFFSDMLLNLAFNDKQLITELSIFKGWLFVAITSGLLLLLIKRKWREIQAALAAATSAEAQFKNIIELAVDGIFIGDHVGTIIGVNSRACDITGYDREEMIGKQIEDLFSPAEMARAPLRYDLIDSGQTVTTERNLAGKDGKAVVVEMRSKRMPDGTLQSFMRDISVRREMERILAASEERFRTLFESVPNIPVQGYDRERRVIFWNAASERFYGFTKEEAIGSLLEDLIIPVEMRSGVIAAVTNWIERGVQVPAGELVLRKKSGEPAPVYSSHVLLINRSDEPEMYCIDVDLSEQKRSEAEIRRLNSDLEQMVAERTAELANALKQMESFSYSISHDLRAPLRAVDGFIQMLQDESTNLTPQGRYCMERVSQNARHMGQLIDDLLQFSRLGRQVLSCQKIEMAQLVNGVLEDFADEIAQRGIVVRVGALSPAQGDPILLRQVLVNLIGNAIKFTSRVAVPVIEISASEDDGAITYSIWDNGAGFDMAYADKLFGVFQRLHSQEEFPGTGVGLAIVQNIIQRHGGKVWVESRPGEGTIVSFRL